MTLAALSSQGPTTLPRATVLRSEAGPRTSVKASAEAPLADSSQPASGAPDTLDLGQIDSAAKAALVPALIPPMILTTMAGMNFASQDGDTYDVGLNLEVSSKSAAQLNYHMPIDASTHRLDGQGSFAGAPAKESYTLDATGLHLTGSLGNNPEQLDVLPTAGGATLAGTVGSVRVQESITNRADRTGSNFDGFLNDVAVHEELTQINVEGSLPRLHLEGHVGDAPVKADETITVNDDAGITLHFDGIVAGQPVHYDHSVLTTQPEPTTRR